MTFELAHVDTKDFRKAQLVCREALNHYGIALLSGAPGLGKTHAVGAFRDGLERPSIYLPMPPRPTSKEIVVRLLRQLGIKPKSRTALYGLVDELLDLLADRPHIVIVDEAQNLNFEGLSQLRYLHDRNGGAWPLLLVGATGCDQLIRSHPELDSRVGTRTTFKPLKGHELLSTLDQMHPLLAATDPELLLQVDDAQCHGVAREWVKLCRIVIPRATAQRKGELDPKLIQAARAVM